MFGEPQAAAFYQTTYTRFLKTFYFLLSYWCKKVVLKLIGLKETLLIHTL
ncbi:hypothetical protein NBRC111894_1631 [Sporolactobacillus inulinus]|uniref:Uncharacterized protein n=1 Tax=Sporolactobacillus inulinus TaxID=2078 RepID=A0A4Y1ZAJ2_9BACL|nr:hypothetical protein NBRC111894_1631 [Sporolactobacillus inulinus]